MINVLRSIFIKRENIFLLLILTLASFLRLFRLSDYMTFLGDEGRDVLIVKHILEGDFTLLGPRSSAADFYYGPIYYYLITPFLWIFRFDPVGPAVFIALVGIATVYLVYHVGREWFGVRGGLVASALYAVSPLVLTYSRSSWNPNPLPFVTLLAFFLLYKGVRKDKWWRFFLVGLLLGIGLQLQYLALFVGVIIFIYTLVGTLFFQHTRKLYFLIKRYFWEGSGFLVGFSPFLAFEILHGFPNSRTIFNYIFGKYSQNISDYKPFGYQVGYAFLKLFGRLLTRFPNIDFAAIQDDFLLQIWFLATITLGILLYFFVIKIKDKDVKILLSIWGILGVVLFGFYHKEIYDYYLGFLFPLPFLLLGNLASISFNTKSLFIKGSVGFLCIVLFLANLAGMPFTKEPNKQKEQVKKIVEFVISKTDNKPFNFALITPGNSDHAYRYYFEILGRKPVEIENMIKDPQRKTVTDQLIVVCEDVSCSPLGHPLFEVAGFGRAEIAGEWDVSVVKVFKLVHYQDNNSKSR
ncbi:MAG: hypothetical protein KatS3mg089_0285 [Patescibacteria group bacterium]|nr:MAG: hypothetical protein KatS3mg089_0285 [Patescibacteria group bacterium]